MDYGNKGRNNMDLYKNFQELAENVDPNDYNIEYIFRPGTEILFLAPHGGGIEPGTSELVRQDSNSYYLFESLRLKNSAELHITSSNFDESVALGAVREHNKVVSFHGYGEDYESMTLIGGTDEELKLKFLNSFVTAGFGAVVVGAGHEFAGMNPENISNKCVSGLSVQLEISTAQRRAFFDKFTSKGRKDTKNQLFHNYMSCVFEAISK